MENYAATPAKKVIEVFNTDARKGLTKKQAGKGLEKYGFNEIIEERKINAIKILISQFTSPLVLVLIAAVLITYFIGDTTDSILILIIVVLNAALGFHQEYSAEKSIEALKKIATPQSEVLREGKITIVESKNIVPGDIIIVEAGSIIPADARIIECTNLRLSEAILTGESVPVEKQSKFIETKSLADMKSMLFSGTEVARGKAKAVVVKTGRGTEIGKIAHLVQHTEREIPLQKKLRVLARKIGIATLLIVIIIFLVGIAYDNPALEMFKTAISLGVAAIPEGLPAVVTVALSIGIRKMAKRNALIRRLVSVETLGRVNVICVDKTGTITRNEMTVKEAYVGGKKLHLKGVGYSIDGKVEGLKKINNNDAERMFACGMLCNNAEMKPEGNFGDPTEIALLVSGMKYFKKAVKKARVGSMDFDSERKMMTTLHKNKNGYVQYTKGAPEKLIDKCSYILVNGKQKKLTKKEKKEVLKEYDKMASNSLRVLGFAYKETSSKKISEENMIFIGLQGMIDPPRENVKQAFEKAAEAGIDVKMITGDYKKTAVAVAKRIGMSGKAITGPEIENMSDAELRKVVDKIDIFARVTPHHKLRILEILEEKKVVAMTGDGVNDAPALKRASIGISVANATDVAKESSDMILLDSHFKSIVAAVEEGRTIFDNIRKFISFLLSCNLAEVEIIFIGTILGLPLPLTPIHLLWINLATDGPPAVALGVDPPEKGIMKRKPIPKKENIINKKMIKSIIVVSTLITVLVLGLFLYYLSIKGENAVEYARTMAFSSLILFEFARVQSVRREGGQGWFSNKKLILALVASILLLLIIIYVPYLQNLFGVVQLAVFDWAIIILLCIVLYTVDTGINKYLIKD